ncbi:hypothetical protein A3K86_07220 [Photobacterium jeanii]|uniref:Uncharacterized protein n=1 Tax=Photobacterium jeanii TaxID=858640 RepID=A0A178KMU3_9GAMM|nr:DUF6172 family protein [Photobacterium jeanii]OAN18669.1 hypothetical protein A3K86_07220 [Photobacterium jeanii]PST91651.1 hypothetical protein C9I91_00250 [Photobacterium jeanii]
MKKTFALTHPKKAVPRVVEAVKYEIKKYLKRENRKALPQGADYWDFDCKYGHTEQEAKVIHVKEINKCLDEAEKLELTSCYIEILAKPATRVKRQPLEDDEF